MLGNFSFGGYFKKETIEMGYWFLTKELGIDADKIWCSVFAGDNKNSRDNESAKILSEMGLKFEEHSREDNFWGPTGNEGPCGPTVEFYIEDVEVWNLVFNEYYFKDGKYESLKTKGVDTGMGLERMLVVLNGLKDVYQTDVFLPVIKRIEELSGKKYQDNQKAFRIIADHLKAATSLSAEGVFASNLDRGYVLRRLIRRAVRYGWTLDMKVLVGVIDPVIYVYGGIYKKLGEGQIVIDRINQEEEKFQKTIEEGLKKADDIFNKKKPIPHNEYSKIIQITNRPDTLGRIHKSASSDSIDPSFKNANISVTNKEVQSAYISGREAFDLYQTYGFPLELILELAQNKNLFVGITDFNEELKKHQEISRAGVSGFKGGLVGESQITTRMHTAPHLLLKALQEVLGSDVHQRGSNINEERIRFDFSYPEPMTDEEIKKVKDIVNQKIAEDIPVVRKETTVEEAKKIGAEAQFINKYGDKVTLYSIGDYSQELCGGPHVKRTGEIGKFKITKEESSSAGVRRIRAVLE